jgi:hypothetical protein
MSRARLAGFRKATRTACTAFALSELGALN